MYFIVIDLYRYKGKLLERIVLWTQSKVKINVHGFFRNYLRKALSALREMEEKLQVDVSNFSEPIITYWLRADESEPVNSASISL